MEPGGPHATPYYVQQSSEKTLRTVVEFTDIVECVMDPIKNLGVQ
jgi:hypothetical protein